MNSFSSFNSTNNKAYTKPPVVTINPPYLWYKFNTEDVLSTTPTYVYNHVTKLYDGSMNSSSIIVTTPTPIEGSASLDCSNITTGITDLKYLRINRFIRFSTKFTICYWLYTTTASQNDHIWDFSQAQGNGGIQFSLTYMNPNTFSVIYGNTFYSTGVTFSLNTWEHYAMVFTPGSNACKMYKNGTLYNVTIATLPSPPLTYVYSLLGKSSWNDISENVHDYNIDDFRIYNLELTKPQITAIYSNTAVYIDISRNIIDISYAGKGTGSSTGDGLGASLATLYSPSGVACDLSMNLYITEWADVSGTGRVRKVDGRTGVISTIARNLYQPASIAVDNSFNVYFSNFNNATAGKIYRISNTGTIYNIYSGTRPIGVSIDVSGALYFNDNVDKFYKLLNPSSIVAPTSATLIASFGTNNYGQACVINNNLQLFISITAGGNDVGYYNISGGTYTTSTFNSIKTLVGNATVGSIAFNSNNICYLIGTTNILYISTNANYTSFTSYSLNSSLYLSILNITQNPCFDICNNFYIPNTGRHTVTKVSNITT